jgi:hypothetical protein
MFQIIYSILHKECGLTRLSDYRIRSREDLKLYPDIKPLKLHCNKCGLEVDPTHFEVWESVRLSVQDVVKETPISEFNKMPGALPTPGFEVIELGEDAL